jgi:cell division septation protein DedD
MAAHAWLNSLKAKNNELKLASGMALASVIIIFLIVLWSVFDTDKSKTEQPDFKENSKVQIHERPTLEKQQSADKNKSKPKKIANTKVAQKSQTPTTKNKIILGQGNYYLQVGAFKQAGLARLMLEKMKNKYQYAKIKKKADKHAVWIGPVITKSDALQLQKYVQRKDNIKGFVTVEK